MTDTPKPSKKTKSKPDAKKPDSSSQPTNPEKDKTTLGDEELVV